MSADADNGLLAVARSTAGRADATPHAASLIQSLRDIGYTCRTAVADIIDNAITAGASEVDILCDAQLEAPMLAIVDNGKGMSRPELIEAMRPGSRNPLAERSPDDLGRFGLGLKSASFSQCKSLTVVTRCNGLTCGATWDLDDVAQTNRWEIELHEDCSALPFVERLGVHGTIVLWRKLDRLGGGIEDMARRAQHIRSVVAETERHIRLVFHRFLEGTKPELVARLNNAKLAPIEPFGTSLPGHQSDPVDALTLLRGTVEFQSHTLPHHSRIPKATWDELGGPEGHLRTQGFYIYRGRRLIIAGSWLGLARQTELTKLCRIRVDIPNTMDADWKIDVKKASAQLPPAVRERMRNLIERLSMTSRRSYQRRGQRLVDDGTMPLWQRIQKDGAVIYRPDPAHPVLADFSSELAPDQQDRFAAIVHLLGASVPVASLHADFAGRPEEVQTEASDEGALSLLAEAMIPRFLAAGTASETIPIVLRQAEPFARNWTIAGPLIDRIIARIFAE